MTKLEKSIRHCLKDYGAGLRAGHYGVAGRTSDTLPKYGFIHAVCADVENGIVTDVRIYAYGDAMLKRDFYGKSIDITNPIEEYLKNRQTWDETISNIEDIINEKGQA